MSQKPTLRRTEVENILMCPSWDGGEHILSGFGTLMHACIEDYWGRCLSAQAESLIDQVEDVVRVAFAKPTGVSMDREQEAIEFMYRFAQYHVADLDHLFAIEKKITLETVPAFLSGTLDRLDLMDGTPDAPIVMKVIDYKSGKYLPEKTYCSFQGLFYGWMAFVTMPTVDEVLIEIDHPLRSDGIAHFTLARNATLLWGGVMVDRLTTALALRSSGAKPIGGAGCTFCRWNKECPESVVPYMHMPSTAEEATAMADAYVRTDVLVKTQRELLKQWTDLHGAVELPGLSVGWHAPMTDDYELPANKQFKAKKVPILGITAATVTEGDITELTGSTATKATTATTATKGKRKNT